MKLFTDIHIGKNFSLEIALFNKIRAFSDGLTVCECKINADWYDGDHCPRYEFELIVLNTMILEIRVYNINHKGDT